MTILTRLPEDYHENTLAIRSSLQSVRFYVDGELRMEYDTSGTRLVRKKLSKLIMCSVRHQRMMQEKKCVLNLPQIQQNILEW